MSAVGNTTPAWNLPIAVAYDDGADKSLITAIAAHELREPSQAILSFLCVLLEERAGPLTPIQRDFLATAEQATRRLKRRIDDLQLVMSGCEGLTVDLRETNLLTRIEECCHELNQIAQTYAVELVVRQHHPERAPLVWGDPDRIDQILLNLIENAIHYSPRGSTVHISLGECGVDDWCIVVENSISQPLRENPNRWFIPRVRGDHGCAERPDGQGLGLFAADVLARAHGGCITAQSEGNSVSICVTFEGCQADVLTSLSGLDWPEPWAAS